MTQVAPFRYLTGSVVPLPSGVPPGIPEFHLPHCFGCGPENASGLALRPRLEGDRVIAEIDFDPRFEGGPGLAHGGAVAAFFDDLMGFVLMAHRSPAVTAKLEMNYLAPIPLGRTIRGEAWLARIEGRKMWVESIGDDARGLRYVEARALFIPVGLDHFARARESAGGYEKDGYYP